MKNCVTISSIHNGYNVKDYYEYTYISCKVWLAIASYGTILLSNSGGKNDHDGGVTYTGRCRSHSRNCRVHGEGEAQGKRNPRLQVVWAVEDQTGRIAALHPRTTRQAEIKKAGSDLLINSVVQAPENSFQLLSDASRSSYLDIYSIVPYGNSSRTRYDISGGGKCITFMYIAQYTPHIQYTAPKKCEVL